MGLRQRTEALFAWFGLIEKNGAQASATPQTTVRDSPRKVAPNDCAEARVIADALVAGHAIVIDLRHAEHQVAQCVLDFTIGSTYALHGTVTATAQGIYLVEPKSKSAEGLSGRGSPPIPPLQGP